MLCVDRVTGIGNTRGDRIERPPIAYGQSGCPVRQRGSKRPGELIAPVRDVGTGLRGRQSIARRFEPATPPLPLIAWQSNDIFHSAEPLVPRYRKSVHVRGRKDIDDALGLVAQQRAQHARVMPARLETLFDRRPKHRLRPDLEETRRAVGGRRLDRAREVHGLPNVPRPVPRPEVARFCSTATYCRVDRDFRSLNADVAHGLLQLRLQGAHLRTVERVHDRQDLMRDVEARHQGLDRFRLAGNGDGERTIDRGYREGFVRPVEETLDLFGRRRDCRHAACAVQSLHQLAAVTDDRHGIFQGQCAGHCGCCDLAETVPDDCVRRDAVVVQQLRKPDLYREDGRLRDFRVAQALFVCVLQHVEQRPAGALGQEVVDSLDCLAEHGFRLEQRATHSDALRSLAGEHEGRGSSTSIGGTALDHARQRLTVDERRQQPGGVCAV